MELLDEERVDKIWYHICTHDFINQSLNVDVTKSFLSKNKYKANKFTAEGKPVYYSYLHIITYHDVILFGSHREKIPLPDIYEIGRVVF